jgi:HlyD family secretion protein
MDEKEIELRSEEFQEVLGNPPSWILRWGITILAATLLVILIGSAMFKYPDVISSTVVLMGQTPPVALVSHASGKIKELYVADNQQVNTGKYLAVIDNPANTDDVIFLRERLNEQNADSLFVFEPSLFPALTLGSLQSAYNQFAAALFSYSEYERFSYYPQKVDITKERIRKFETQLQNLKRQQEIAKEQFLLAQTQFGRDSTLHNKGFISDNDYEDVRKTFLQNQLAIENMRFTIENMKIQIAELKEGLFETGHNDSEKQNALKIQLHSAEEQLKAELTAWEQTYALVSPIDGKITFTKYWNKNQNVTAGEEIFTVVPEKQSEIIGKAQLPVTRSGKVKTGQRVNIHLENFPDTEFGTLRGIVKNVSKVPVKENNGVFYTVEISLPHGLTSTYNKRLPDLPDFQGRADIVTEDISLLERFIQPIRKIWTEGRE